MHEFTKIFADRWISNSLEDTIIALRAWMTRTIVLSFLCSLCLKVLSGSNIDRRNVSIWYIIQVSTPEEVKFLKKQMIMICIQIV